jgi:prevent-host-death family protein
MQCNMFEAKSQLSKLVQAALDGEEVLIANNGVPVVRIVKIDAQKPARKAGAWAKLPKAAPDWDAPETNAVIADALSDGKLL